MTILAGVVIVTAVMDGGILDRAQTALRENERAEVEDIVMASYVYKTTASMNVVGQLDLEETAKAIYSNLTESDYKMKTLAGAEAQSYEEIYTPGASSINLKVEGKSGTYEGTVEKNGLRDGMKIVEDTGNAVPPADDGNNPPENDNEEIEISSEKDLPVVGYFYNTMYNPEQPEIVSIEEYYGDEKDNNKVSDMNEELNAYISSCDFDIPVTFFKEDAPTQGDIQVTITHYDGREENITLTQSSNNNKRWEYASRILTGKEDDVVWEEYIALTLYPYAKHSSSPSRYETNSEYHYLSIDAGNAVPFHKLTIFGKTIEFPFNCQAHIGWEEEWFETIDPLYTNISDVSNVIVNYSDGTNKLYSSEDIYDANLYYMDWFYFSSKEVPILYTDGAFIINMPDSNFKKQITSIVVVENGIAKKFNITSDTQIISSNAWN